MDSRAYFKSSFPSFCGCRDILRKSLDCSEDDSVIFTGSGCTGAVHKLVCCLGLDKLDKPPVVFVSPFEHHSNLLPWMECAGGAEVSNE